METEQHAIERPLGKRKNEEILEIKIYMERNDKDDTTFWNVWVSAKAVVRRKCKAIQAHIKNQEII